MEFLLPLLNRISPWVQGVVLQYTTNWLVLLVLVKPPPLSAEGSYVQTFELPENLS